MSKISYAWAVVFLCTVCKAQFFYNDDEHHQPAFQEPISSPGTYDQGNSPAVVQQNPSRQRAHSENYGEQVNYQPAPQAPPVTIPRYEHRQSVNSGRGRRQQRIEQLQPPPRVYSPSVFENLALGMPPAGVSIPEDSFLNVLRNDGRRAHTSHNPVQEPPAPQYAPSLPAPPVQTQTLRAPVRTNFAYSGAPALPSWAQTFASPSPVQIRHQPQIERSQPEANRVPEEYQAPVEIPLQPQPQQSSRRRSGTRYRQTTRAQPSWNPAYVEPQQQRVFSPSVFENLGLGVAPSGVDVPEDSLLNILRNDKPVHRARRNQVYQPAPPVASAEQYTPQQYSGEPRSAAEPHSAELEIPQEIPNVQQAPGRDNRQLQLTVQQPRQQPVRQPLQQPLQQPVRQPRQRPVGQLRQQPVQQPEFVDNSANYQGAEEQLEVVQQPRPVQKRRRVSVRKYRQNIGSTPGTGLDQAEELNQPPKQYAPSVFEKIGLGEAPPGIYVPEDSFLNLLRGDRPVTQTVQRSVNQRSHIRQAAAPSPPQYTTSDISETENFPGPDYNVQQDAYDRQDRSRVLHANQLPPQQQHQSLPTQEYPQPQVNIRPERQYQRQLPPRIQQPAVAPRAPQPPKRPRQRSRTQPISAPQPQPVHEIPETTYNVNQDLQQEDDILRYRNQENNQGVRQQALARRRDRIADPQHVPPPQPVYEVPQSYNADLSFQEDDIPRRRPQPGNQRRRTQVQQPAQHQPRTSSHGGALQAQNTRHEAPAARQEPRPKTAKLSVKPLPDDVDGDQIPGEAGFDYPTLHVIPKTGFSCAQQPHNGYYADLETSCQVVHMCQAGGVQSSFLCPNGTIFNQEKFSCQWWYKVNCADAPRHYGINDKLYKVPPPPERSSRRT